MRAIDDSGNIGADAGHRRPARSPVPSTLFGQRVPAVPATDDGGAVTLGVRFVPQNDGTITGVRFYKGAGNTGTHTGQRVVGRRRRCCAPARSAARSAGGWQTLTFSQPLPVTAGTTYVASYFAPNGRYAADDRFFSSRDHVAAPLAAPARTGDRAATGCSGFGTGFPAEASSTDANYYVDVMFVDGGAAAPSVLTTAPAAGAAGVAVDVRRQRAVLAAGRGRERPVHRDGRSRRARAPARPRTTPPAAPRRSRRPPPWRSGRRTPRR